jgi:hypothetical protein
MGWQGKCAAALPSLLAVLAFGLSACGGNDSSDESASSADAGTTSATGASGPTGDTGSGAATGATSATGKSGTGGASAPSGSPSKPAKRKPPNGSSSPDSTKPSKPKALQIPGYDPNNPTKAQLATLYSQAKEVCGYLTLSGLAYEYEVPQTPDAVAKAYSKFYPKAQRRAVYRGCRDGVS